MLRQDIQFIHVLPALICICGLTMMIVGKKTGIKDLEYMGMILPWFGVMLAWHVC